ncbi:DgyrCDS14010 [Dimorphilus gyrociliatus]|uniref:DgyrCDS14010 n=1 Tax=Dimorphilus gyrociliatus TaxID=2664684 RepID=A0A7I8WCB2_9ANNE|nr:DgyrCDS14010 [Dimorphilus gyrociliatus]
MDKDRLKMKKEKRNSIIHNLRYNIHFFTLWVLLEGILFGSMKFYSLGVTRTLERRFNLRGVETGFMNGIEDVGTIVVILLVGYMGKIFSKPKLIGCFMMLISFGYFIFAIPFFIEGPKFSGFPSENFTEDRYSNDSNRDFCKMSQSIKDICTNHTNSGNKRAFIIFICANILMGLGESSLFTLGIAYIYENSSRKQASFLLGSIMLSFLLAPGVGLPLSSALTKIPENLISSPYEPGDQRFVGAWWVGYVILSAAMFIVTLDSLNPKLAKLLLEKSVSSLTKFKAVASDIPRSFFMIFKNIPLIIFIFGDCFVMFAIVGYSSASTRYLEAHFKMPIHRANFILGIIMVVPGIIGCALSSILSRFVEKRRALAACALLSYLSAVIPIILMQFSCSQTNLNGITANESIKGCTEECNCNDMTYDPVCDSQGINYFSPCAAGCNASFVNETFINCKCSPGGVVKKGLCFTPCSNLNIYIIISTISVVIHMLNKIPASIVQLRLSIHILTCVLMFMGAVMYTIVFLISRKVKFYSNDDKEIVIDIKETAENDNDDEVVDKDKEANLKLMPVEKQTVT